MLSEKELVRAQQEQDKVLSSGRPTQRLLRSVCVDCIYDPSSEGSAKAQIAGCTCSACVLHPLRHLWAGEPA